MMRFSFIFRLLIAALFLWAGGVKLHALCTTHQHTVQSMVELYLGTSGPWRWLAAGAEVGLGCWVLVGLPLKLALGTALVVLMVFTVLLTWELTKENPVPCGCGAMDYAFLFGPLPATTKSLMGLPQRDLRPIQLALGISLVRNLVMMVAIGFMLDRLRNTSGSSSKAKERKSLD